MSDAFPTDTELAEVEDAAALAVDPAVARAELRVALLQELTQIGMTLARGLGEAAGVEAPASDERAKAPAKDPVDAFARISRAVRLTISLEEKADVALRDLRAGVVAQRARRRKAIAEQELSHASVRDSHQECHVTKLITSLIDREAPDRETFDALIEAFHERLDEDEAYEQIGEIPLRQAVEIVCADLCLKPDWSKWDGESFGFDADYFRHPGSKYQQPRQTPFWFDGATPEERRRRIAEGWGDQGPAPSP